MASLNAHSLAPAARSLPRVASDVSFEEALAVIRREGVLIIEGATPADALDRVTAELHPWFERAHRGAGQFFGRSTRRFSGVFAKAPSAAALALHPLVTQLFEAVLKGEDEAPRCDVIDLNLTQAIGIEPGEPAQFLHRDEELWPFPRTFEVMTNAMWALDDFTEENGATRLIPGSHLWPRDREPQPGEALSAVAPRGSVVLWLGGVLHGGGANASNQLRRGVVISYKLGWLAPAEKLLLSIPPETARRLPEPLQRLLGYQLHRPNLGWVEGQDPIRWLHGEFQELAPTEDNLTPLHDALLTDLNQNPDRYLGYVT